MLQLEIKPKIASFALMVSVIVISVMPINSSAQGFPLTTTNCGHEVVIKSIPERLVVVNSDALAVLDALDALDLVVARTGSLVREAYSAETLAKIDAIPVISTTSSSTGGSVIGLETIISMAPDVVLAPEKAVDRDMLGAADIPLYAPVAFCSVPEAGENGYASFDMVFDQLRKYGEILGRSNKAESAIAKMKATLESTKSTGNTSDGTAIAVYVGSERSLYFYGRRSMIDPIFDAVGLENVFGDEDQRVFSGGLEDFIKRDPQTVVLLYSGTPPEKIHDLFLSVPGIDGLSAVRNNRVLTLPFPFTDPPTPMSIAGVQVLKSKLNLLP